jgi:UDP-N-acetylglucosamine/UDP-N-acetylgalactosamine diphosphorylase
MHAPYYTGRSPSKHHPTHIIDFPKDSPMSNHPVDTSKITEQKAAIESFTKIFPRDLKPVDLSLAQPSFHPSPLLEGKKVGCIVMAGGQATRLGSLIPKGAIPFSPVAGKPLLQMTAERVLAYSRCYGIEPRLAIMTSENTDTGIRALFERCHYFGLHHVDFFIQTSLPLLDMNEEVIARDDGSLLTGPDGNGSVFAGIVHSGIFDQWMRDGIEAVSVIMVDNPLLDPFQPQLLAPLFSGADLTANAIERKSADEQVGLFAEENGRIQVVEYSEIGSVLGAQRDSAGRLLFRWANISSFGCTMDFIRKASTLTLPFHAAKKKVEGHEVWKAEYFVFDALSAARTIKLIPLIREESFAPIKDKDSFAKAQAAIMERDRKRFFALTGKQSDPSLPFELSASAFYPTDRFVEWLRGCGVRSGRIEETSEES